MTNKEIEQQEKKDEDNFGNEIDWFLLIGVVIGIGGIVFAWKRFIWEFLKKYF